ncbi:MAG: TonB-dependent receptor domain-containing protein, partial [Chitinophagales bacterium]
YHVHAGAESKIVFGGGYFQYHGKHFGEVIWSEYGFHIPQNYTYYHNAAEKNDGNVFIQWNWSRRKFSALSDMQFRFIDYNFLGFDSDLNNVQQNIAYQFINPKINVSYRASDMLQFYACIAYTSKEPNRDDFVYSSTATRPGPEHLTDFELGGRWQFNGWNLIPNMYCMLYRDQLILDGSINDVGAYTRVNVPESYRTGVELSVSKVWENTLNINGNFTLSRNLIRNFTEYIDNWDTGEQEKLNYDKTIISFSPSIIGFASTEYNLMHAIFKDTKNSELLIRVDAKYVSRQYLDNSADLSRSLNQYLINDCYLTFKFPFRSGAVFSSSLAVTNFLNESYISNGWVYKYFYNNEQLAINGYYPQAGRAFYFKSAVRL